MQLVAQSHTNFRSKAYWRNSYEGERLENLNDWYGVPSNYKQVIQNEIEKDAEKPVILQVGDAIRGLPEFLKRELSSENIRVIVSDIPIPNKDTVIPRELGKGLSSNGLGSKSSFDWIVDCGYSDKLTCSMDSSRLPVETSCYFDKALTLLKPRGKLFIVTLAHQCLIASWLRYFCTKKLEYSCYAIGLDGAHDCCNPFVLVVTNSETTINQPQ